MRYLLRILGGTGLAVGLAFSAGATPADLTIGPDRPVNLSILLDDAGIFAQDPGALLVPIAGGGSLTFPGGGAVEVGIAGPDWAAGLIALFGESPDDITCQPAGTPCTTTGVIASSVTAVVHHLTAAGVSDPTLGTGPPVGFDWSAALVVDLSALGLGLLPVLLTQRDTDPVAVAANGGDWFFRTEPDGLAFSCDEANPINIPVGECDALNFRTEQAYDPATGLATILSVITTGLGDPLFNVTGFALCETPANGGADFDCDGIDDASDPCAVWYNNDLTDSNGDGIPNNCQCSDTNEDGFVTSVDAFAMVACVADPACVQGPIVEDLWDANNDGFVVSVDAFLAVGKIPTGNFFELTCARRPEGTPAP